MSVWDDKKIQILKENWGTLTASVIAKKIGPGVSRNSVIGGFPPLVNGRGKFFMWKSSQITLICKN